MTRNMKLRAWDALDKKMIYFDFEDVLTGEVPLHPYSGDWDLMVASNQVDMHGKPIYDKDIVELINADHERIRVVCIYGVARRKMDTGWTCDINGFYFETSDGFQSFPIVRNYADVHDLDLMEVIGNTYENPKLFESEVTV